jgi:hypothetical protein
LVLSLGMGLLRLHLVRLCVDQHRFGGFLVHHIHPQESLGGQIRKGERTERVARAAMAGEQCALKGACRSPARSHLQEGEAELRLFRQELARFVWLCEHHGLELSHDKVDAFWGGGLNLLDQILGGVCAAGLLLLKRGLRRGRLLRRRRACLLA